MTLLTTYQSAAYYLKQLGIKSCFLFIFIFLPTYVVHADETPHPSLEKQTSEDALVDFQRQIIQSRHRLDKTPDVTLENVASYQLPGAAIIPSSPKHDKPATMNYILNRAVNLPRNAEAGSISVQKGAIVFTP